VGLSTRVSARDPIHEQNIAGRAFAVKLATKGFPVFLTSGFDLYHHFRNDAFCDLYNLLKVWKTGKREVVMLQPLPQTLYRSQYLGPSTRVPARYPIQEQKF